MSRRLYLHLPAGSSENHRQPVRDDPAGKASVAKADLVSAYDDAQVGRRCDDREHLDARSSPRVYTVRLDDGPRVNGTLTLDAKGDQNAVWIFQLGRAHANNGSKVLLSTGPRRPTCSGDRSLVDHRNERSTSRNRCWPSRRIRRYRLHRRGQIVCTTGAITRSPT